MRALLLCLVWTVVGTIAFARQYLDRPAGIDGQLLPAYAEWLTCYLPWGVLSVAILPIERRFPLGRPGWARHLLVLALVSVPMAYAAWLMTAALGALVEAVTGRRVAPDDAGLADAGARSARARAALLDVGRWRHGAAHADRRARERAPRRAADAREGAAGDEPAPGRARRAADAPAAALPVQQPAEHLGADAARSGDGRTDADPARRSAARVAGPRSRSRDDAGDRDRADESLPGRRGDALRRSAVVDRGRRARNGAGARPDVPAPAAGRERAAPRPPASARGDVARAARRADDPERARRRPAGPRSSATTASASPDELVAGRLRHRPRRDVRAARAPLPRAPHVRDARRCRKAAPRCASRCPSASRPPEVAQHAHAAGADRGR